jgi:hypothetical protein
MHLLRLLTIIMVCLVLSSLAWADVVDQDAVIQTQPQETDNVIIHQTTPASPGKAPFGAVLTSFLFRGCYDQFGILGFNPLKSINLQGGIAGQPSWAMAFENDFVDSGNVHTMEWYLNYNSENDVNLKYFRPIYTSVLFSPDSGAQRAYTRFDIGTSSKYPGTFLLRAGSKDLFTFTKASAKFYFPEVDVYSNLFVNNSRYGGATFLIMGDNATGSRSSLCLKAGAGRYNWLISTQLHVANALEIIPSTKPDGMTFTAPAFVASYDGRCAVGAPNSPPNNTALPSGTMTFYLDQANNRLMVNVKYSDGTLKTGVIPLFDLQ